MVTCKIKHLQNVLVFYFTCKDGLTLLFLLGALKCSVDDDDDDDDEWISRLLSVQ